MDKLISANKLRKTFVSLCSLLLAACILLGTGCEGRTTGAPLPEDTGSKPPADASPDPEPEALTVPDADPEEYGDLVISKVYGTGGPSSPCGHAFVELTNTGSAPLPLGPLALYCAVGKASGYASYPLPDITLEGGESCLIRGAASPEYDASNEVLRIESCDAECALALNSREIRLVLAVRGQTFESEAGPEELPGVISYFGATEAYFFDTGFVSGFTDRTMAVRTAMKQDSGYFLQDLTDSTTEKLNQIAPVSKDGTRAAVVRSMLDEVKFSHPAGFYDAPIELALTAPAGYDAVYYTTDGSDPASSVTRKKYEKPIPLSDTTETAFGRTYASGLNFVGQIASNAKKMIGAHVIKACAAKGKSTSGVYTNTYFISAKMREYGVSVLSASMPIRQMFGTPGFYHNFNPSSNDPNTRGKAFLEVFDKDGVRRGYSNVELAASGHGSSGTGMRSMKVFCKASDNTADGTDPALHFDLFGGYAKNAKGQSITSFSRLVLRNSGNDCGSSYIRDAYMQRLSEGMAADTMAYAPVLVFVNGDFWGIYNARERYSGEYVESHYGIDKDNVALIESDYSKVHTDQNAKFIVSSGSPDDADEFNDLVKFIRKNKLDKKENFAYVESRLDLDSLIDLFVSRLYFSAIDFPGNNIKLWRNRAPNDLPGADPSGADNRWHFVLLDMDMGLSFYKDANSTTETSNYFSWLRSDGTVASTIIHKLLANEGFKNRFLARFYQVLNEIYVPDRMEEVLDGITAERAPIEKLQSMRWGADLNKYNKAISDIRQFVQRRNKYALRFLCSFFDVTEDEIAQICARVKAEEKRRGMPVVPADPR
ncbi:MAG: hypothetical protein E7576_16730 [Ruminococcaceae bacterium]|nr:hypothetical protein [Oscillospiraceae bacterium]